MGFGRPRRHYRRTDSTNARARELAQAGAPSGTIVTAAEQSAGRGRRGRAWSAPAGKALLCSAILTPLERRHGLLPLAVPLAVCEAIESVAPVECRLKWPNDVWIEERKVSGVLIESRPPHWAVIGVGVNVAIDEHEFPAELRWPATSVGRGAGVERVLAALNKALELWAPAPAERVLESFRRRDVLAGRAVSWEGGPAGAASGRGTADGIDELGNLEVVEAERGERLRLGSGEVQLTVE